MAGGGIKWAAVHDGPRAICVQHAAHGVELLPRARAGARRDAGGDLRRGLREWLGLQVPLWRLDCERELRLDWRDDSLCLCATRATHGVA